TTIAAILYLNSRRRRLINHKLALRNEQIVRSNEVLSDLNQEKNTLMNIVAHDLKSPLNRISGLASVMELDGELPAKLQRYVKLIRESTHSGLNLITDLLDVNALEQVNNSPEIKEISIPALLEERIRSMQMAADSKSIKLELNVNIDKPVRTDESYV